MSLIALQDQYAPHNACFGCGPSNLKGLQLKSFVRDDGNVIATWQPQSFHEAFPGILNGGIIGALLDCHSNWTAAYLLMKEHNDKTPPCTVTAFFNVSLHKPTPSQKQVHLTATCTKLKDDRAYIHAELYSQDILCASCDGLFVAVKPDHPAYHRW